MKETQETQVQSLVRENPMEKKMATYSSILAGIMLWTEEHGGIQSMGLQRSQIQLSNFNRKLASKQPESKQPGSETTRTENLDQSPLLPEPAWAAITPSPGWLRQQIFISHSARGWKSGLLDGETAWLSSWWGQLFLGMSSNDFSLEFAHREKEPISFPLFKRALISKLRFFQ